MVRGRLALSGQVKGHVARQPVPAWRGPEYERDGNMHFDKWADSDYGFAPTPRQLSF
jgi:hypothetical protein